MSHWELIIADQHVSDYEPSHHSDRIMGDNDRVSENDELSDRQQILCSDTHNCAYSAVEDVFKRNRYNETEN
jgi:hypothetical protein